MEIPPKRWRKFFVSLYQFLTPTVFFSAGKRIRLQDPSNLSSIDLSIYEELDLDSPSPSIGTPVGSARGRYKKVTVERPAISPAVQPGQRQHKQYPKKSSSQKPSSGRTNRTKKKATTEEAGRAKRARKDKTLYFNELKRHSKDRLSNSFYLISITDNTFLSSCTEIVTFQAGLHSSILSATIARNLDPTVAVTQANLLSTLFRRLTFHMNLACQIARNIENIALRLVFESKILSAETKHIFYRSLLYADEAGKESKTGTNGGSKTHQWALKAVLGCPDEPPPSDNPDCEFILRHDEDAFAGFSPDGTVKKPYKVFPACPGDPHLKYLIEVLFHNNVVVGNILLLARREFFNGYCGRWEEMPPLPSCSYMWRLTEEIARQMDTETAANLTNNFLHHQSAYISHQLKQFRQAHPELHFDYKLLQLLPELLTYLVDFLPLESRPDLEDAKKKVNYDNLELLQQFVEEERRSLGAMMNSTVKDFDDIEDVEDNIGVDIKFALGWDGRKCIQADYLFPALLKMANNASLSAVMIPENRLVNRPITFNSAMTESLLRKLPVFAKKYDLDEDVAIEILQQFNDYVGSKNEESADYDLISVDFLAKVR